MVVERLTFGFAMKRNVCGDSDDIGCSWLHTNMDLFSTYVATFVVFAYLYLGMRNTDRVMA